MLLMLSTALPFRSSFFMHDYHRLYLYCNRHSMTSSKATTYFQQCMAGRAGRIALTVFLFLRTHRFYGPRHLAVMLSRVTLIRQKRHATTMSVSTSLKTNMAASRDPLCHMTSLHERVTWPLVLYYRLMQFRAIFFPVIKRNHPVNTLDFRLIKR